MGGDRHIQARYRGWLRRRYSLRWSLPPPLAPALHLGGVLPPILPRPSGLSAGSAAMPLSSSRKERPAAILIRTEGERRAHLEQRLKETTREALHDTSAHVRQDRAGAGVAHDSRRANDKGARALIEPPRGNGR